MVLNITRFPTNTSPARTFARKTGVGTPTVTGLGGPAASITESKTFVINRLALSFQESSSHPSFKIKKKTIPP